MLVKPRKEKCIPIKHGGPQANVEAYANLEDGTVEDVSWNEGPSDKFYGATGTITSRPYSGRAGDNYDRIFGHGTYR